MKFYDVGWEKQKPNAATRVRRSRRIEKAFHILQFLVLLYVVSRFSSGLSVSFKFSGKWDRGDSDTIVSPRFVFLVVNAIIVALVLGSGKLSESEGEKVTDYYDEYVKKRPNTLRKAMKSPEIPPERRMISTAFEKLEKPATQTAKFRGGVDSGLAPQPNIVVKLEKPAAIRGGVVSELAHLPNIVATKAAEEMTFQPQPVVNKETIKENVSQRTPTNSRKKSPVIGVSAATGEELTGEELRHKAEAFIERHRRFLLGA